MARTPKTKTPATTGPAPQTRGYVHTKTDATARPEAGAAPRFKAKQDSATYRYDSSLAPVLDWDEQPARDVAAWLLAQIEDAAALPGQTFPQPRVLTGADGKPLMTVVGLRDALARLKAIQKPCLNWTGKAKRLSLDLPTLQFFIHERLCTAAIIETLEGHRKVPEQSNLFSLFADERMPMAKPADASAKSNGCWRRGDASIQDWASAKGVGRASVGWPSNLVGSIPDGKQISVVFPREVPSNTKGSNAFSVSVPTFESLTEI
jgi:hypothetical protein